MKGAEFYESILRNYKNGLIINTGFLSMLPNHSSKLSASLPCILSMLESLSLGKINWGKFLSLNVNYMIFSRD